MRKLSHQLWLEPNLQSDTQKTHGGEPSRGKRKTRRPLVIKKSHHVVLRAERAHGVRALIKHSPLIHAILKKAARRFQVKIYRRAVHWNHLHLSVKGSSRQGLQNFFRVVAGHIAQEILQQFPLPPGMDRPTHRKFWDDLLFSRIVDWGRYFRAVCHYIQLNVRQTQIHGSAVKKSINNTS